MKSAVVAVVSLALLAGTLRAEDKPALKTDKDKVSYGYGMQFGTWLKRNSIDLDLDLFLKAIRDTEAGKDTLLTQTEMQEVMSKYQRELATKQMERRKLDSEKNKKEGEAFLAANSKKPGVVTQPSGLQYKILKDSTGPSPKATDTVTVEYRGTLTDGTEFDSSAKAGHPATFEISHVIRGWIEALQKMKVGSKWELFIPSALAYGERGYPPMIGPNATLIFDVELLAIKEPPPAPHTAAPPTPPTPVTSDIIKVPSAEEMKKGAKIEIIKPGQTNVVK